MMNRMLAMLPKYVFSYFAFIKMHLDTVSGQLKYAGVGQLRPLTLERSNLAFVDKVH